MRPGVALHDKLVRARYQVEAVGVIELLADVLPEGVACAARRDAPAAAVVWVRPQQIAHGPLVRHLHIIAAQLPSETPPGYHFRSPD